MLQGFIDYLDSIKARDPAARSRLGVALFYPGLHAVLLHRVSHWLWRRGLTFPAQALSQFGRFLTGIEIHHSATLG